MGPGPSQEEYACLASSGHKDATVVECDVARSLWSLTKGWSEEARQRQRAALHRLLTACVAGSGGSIRYYQGLHDVAAVLLFAVGERCAFRLLTRLAAQQLRDATRPTLEPVVELLHLLYPILLQCDVELYDHIEANGIPPFFALSWFITWFAHNVDDRQQITRLFDLFLASHPLMPLYVAAVAMRANREQLLSCHDPADLHHALSNMPILGPGRPSADELAQQAAALYSTVPPASLRLSHGAGLQQSVAAAAFKVHGRWAVPEEPPPNTGQFAHNTVSQLQRLFHPNKPRTRAARVVAAMATATGLAAVGVAVLLGQLQQQGHMGPWGSFLR
ncbi:hypothetical protein N2152v2_007060 [Parachlorella kessleri]